MRSDTSTQELLQEHAGSVLLDVHTAMPGIVKSYSATEQTATVQPAIQRVLDGEHETLPPIPDVPVAWPAGGGFALVFPLVPGDTVWLMFSESAWAQYRETGQVSRPGDLTRHSLSYPLAYPFSRVAIGGAGARIVAPTPLAVGDDVAAQFVVLEQKLMTWLNAHVHTGVTTGLGSSGPPATFAIPGQLAATKLRAE
jgi:hypothetical protein